MLSKKGTISKSAEDTAEVAKVFLDEILNKNSKSAEALVVGLSGDLGAGKTTFTQAVAKHLGIKSKVNSPTFVIMKKYPLKNGGKHEFLFHLDAYRLKNEKELLHLGWDQIVSDPKNLVLIEWPEIVKKAMPRGTRMIHVAHTKEGHRSFKLK